MADEEDEDGAPGPPTLTPTTSHPPAAKVTWLVQGGAYFLGVITPFLTGWGPSCMGTG